MGNWNRRYTPRRKYNHFRYEDPPLSPKSNYYNHGSYSSGVESSGVPSWEISYCNSVRVPWHKVLASKKYLFCHPTVFNWDDSGAKEALERAKERYWAKTSGFPCESSLPDPNMYIDEIDWNPYVDPQLMEDLEGQFFNPDDEHEVDKWDSGNDKTECNVENPWEKNMVQGGGLTDIAPGWGQWDNSVNLKKNDPWQQSGDWLADSGKEYGWRSGNESWGRNQGHDNGIKPSAVGDYRFGGTWNHGSQAIPVNSEGWGQREVNVQGWSLGNANDQKSSNFGNYGDSWGNNYTTGSKGRGWMNKEDPSRGWRGSEFPVNDTRGWDSGQLRRGGSTYRGGGRKRENSIQDTSKYKSSRYQGYDRGGNRWV